MDVLHASRYIMLHNIFHDLVRDIFESTSWQIQNIFSSWIYLREICFSDTGYIKVFKISGKQYLNILQSMFMHLDISCTSFNFLGRFKLFQKNIFAKFLQKLLQYYPKETYTVILILKFDHKREFCGIGIKTWYFGEKIVQNEKDILILRIGKQNNSLKNIIP